MEEKSTIRIVSIGELGGGTSYFSRDNNIGFYHWLRDRISQGKAPDHIVFHGEAFPEMTPYVSKSGVSKNLVLDETVSSYDEAVVFIKPYLSRLADLIKKNHLDTGITYVMSEGDHKNITNERDRISQAYNSAPKEIIELMEGYSEKITATEAILESHNVTRRKHKEELKGLQEKLERAVKRRAKESEITRLAKGVENYKKGLVYIDEKASERQDEINDYTRIRDLYKQLFVLWSRENDMSVEKFTKTFDEKLTWELYEIYENSRGQRKPAVQLEKETREAIEKIKKQMAAIERTDPEYEKGRFRVLEETSKNLSNMLNKITHDRISEVKKEAQNKSQAKRVQISRFSNNIPGTPDLTKIANEIAHATINASIRSAFGRRIKLNIVEDNLATVDVKGLKVTVMNKPTNTSTQTFSKVPVKIGGMLRSEGDGEWEVVIGSRSPQATVRVAPQSNRSDKSVYQLTSAPFVDASKLEEAWNSKIKTSFTDVAAKGAISSGFDELEFDGYGFKHNFYTSQALRLYADKEKRSQAKILAKEIRIMVPNAGAYTQLEHMELMQLNGKLPSEVRGKTQMQQLLVSLGVDVKDSSQRKELAEHIEDLDFRGGSPGIQVALKWFSDRMGPAEAERSAKTLDFLLLTDVHVGSPAGGYPNRLLLQSLGQYITNTVTAPYVLAMLGDNIEGSLRDHKNEPYAETDPTNEMRFKEFLKKKGISEGSTEFKRNFDEYTSLLALKQPIQSSNDQAALFVSDAAPLIKKAALHIVVSGNHYNKSQDHKQSDEAKVLGSMIKPSLPKEKQEKIQIVPGGDWGHGTFELGDGLKIRVGHKVDSKIELDKMSGEQMVTLGGHIHSHTVTINGNKAVVTGTMQQGITNYPEMIGIPVSENLRGMSRFSVTYADKDTPLIYTDSFISYSELVSRGYIKENPLIKEFETTRNVVQLKVAKSKSF